MLEFISSLNYNCGCSGFVGEFVLWRNGIYLQKIKRCKSYISPQKNYL